MGSLYGFEVKSALPLRRLNAAAGTRGELRIEDAADPLEAPAGEPTSSVTGEDGRRWFASYELGDGACLLELPPTGRFLLRPAERTVVVDSWNDDAELLEHRVASAAVCTLLAMDGDLALHAAAVETPSGAVIFCGPTRRGKSTLTRALGDRGHPVLAEDGIVLELGTTGAVAFPGARGVRVRRDDRVDGTYTELLADPGPEEPAACAAAAIVLLGERGNGLQVDRLEPAPALALLASNLVHSGSRASLAAAFGRLARLLRFVPAFAVAFPDDLEALPAAALDLLDSTGVRG